MGALRGGEGVCAHAMNLRLSGSSTEFSRVVEQAPPSTECVLEDLGGRGSCRAETAASERTASGE
jgi:hypothetical protein